MGVYKKNNRWYLDYYQPNGKRKRESVTIDGIDPSKITRTDAEKALCIRKAEIAQGKFHIVNGNKKLPFKSLVGKYLEWAQENHRTPKRDYYACQQLLRYFPNKDATKINLWDIEKYKSERKSEGRKPETINKELGTLRRMFNLAMEWKLINENPLQGLKLIRVGKREYRVLKDWEFQKLYESASELFKPVLLTAYMTGMRKSEIQKLRWQDIDLKENNIYVRNTKNLEDRTIPISKSLLNVLIELKKASVSDYVFTYNGHPYLSDSAWYKTWRTTLNKSGIDKCRFHDLRHTFVSNLIVNHKEDFATVMALSGHKDISMLKRYSHTREQAKRIAINKLEKGYQDRDLKDFRIKSIKHISSDL